MEPSEQTTIQLVSQPKVKKRRIISKIKISESHSEQEKALGSLPEE